MRKGDKDRKTGRAGTWRLVLYTSTDEASTQYRTNWKHDDKAASHADGLVSLEWMNWPELNGVSFHVREQRQSAYLGPGARYNGQSTLAE